MNRSIRPVTREDAAEIARIYNHYVAETYITFETDVVSVAEMAERIADILAIPLPWLVIEEANGLLGYAYASKWKSRYAYRFAVESTIYLDPTHFGRGLGSDLYTELLTCLRGLPVHAVMGGIALPNPASIALHERLGFQKVAHFQQVGFKHGRWIDVGYWQLLLPIPSS